MHTTPGSPTATAPAASAAQSAYMTIKRRILSGEYPAGEMLGEQALAAGFGTSRTPVREAIGRLQAEGWLRVHPKRGAQVTAPGPRERADLIEARLLLEGHGVRRAVADGRAQALAERLTTWLAAQTGAHDRGEDVAALDARFHAELAAGAGNAVLDTAYAGIRERQERMTATALWQRTDLSGRVLVEHARLVELVAVGDVDAFCTELAAHIAGVHG